MRHTLIIKRNAEPEQRRGYLVYIYHLMNLPIYIGITDFEPDIMDIDKMPKLVYVVTMAAAANAPDGRCELEIEVHARDLDQAGALALSASLITILQPAYQAPFSPERYERENPRVQHVGSGKVYKSAYAAARAHQISIAQLYDVLAIGRSRAAKGERFIRTARPVTDFLIKGAIVPADRVLGTVSERRPVQPSWPVTER